METGMETGTGTGMGMETGMGTGTGTGEGEGRGFPCAGRRVITPSATAYHTGPGLRPARTKRQREFESTVDEESRAKQAEDWGRGVGSW